MDYQILLASHGKLASGLLSSVEIILGKQDSISVIDAYTTDNYDLEKEITSFFNKNQKPCVVVTDILGGSVHTKLKELKEEYQYHLLTGMNLALVLNLALKLETMSIEDALSESCEEAKQSICIDTDVALEIEDEDF
ncbi:PTS sugar transporter subunit IIA [Erysipelothrix urinaevulpis]|uniref:PTS sugar transporter subunit IIA n=1 Tax=Erysipelothrix urinaevulpis TaxID=2683717 RepID=UPI00135C3BED|nr:PTS fructose IIA subunit [Erysipelothrix urinaevulpis]